MSRVAALVRPKEPLEWVERAVPVPGPGEVLIRVEACGLGQNDWNVAMLDALPHLPLVPGQEAVGVVMSVGEGVSLPVGERVGVTPLARSCTVCVPCQRGLPAYCEQVELHGFHRDGACGEEVVVSAQHLVTGIHPERRGEAPKSKDGRTDAAELAALLGSGWTALGALRAGAVGAGLRVGIWGIGGVGHLAVQLAKQARAHVIAIEPDPARAALATELGATVEKSPTAIDVALVCTPSTQAIQHAHQAARKAGTIVLVGASPSGRFDLPLQAQVSKGLTVRGSFLGMASELREVLRAYDDGWLKPRVTRVPMSEAPARLYALRDGGHVGRLIFEP